MTQATRAQRIDQIANEVLAILRTGEQVAPFSSRYPGFDLAEAYDVVEQVRDMRKARGETAIGRFTNRAVWGSYGISGPIWNFMFDSTVNALAAADEIVTLRLTTVPIDVFGTWQLKSGLARPFAFLARKVQRLDSGHSAARSRLYYRRSKSWRRFPNGLPRHRR
jgi:hypothetical protein